MVDKIVLPEDVKKIITKLEEAGFEAYAVGGCVRDSLLHKEPKDWDITTSATPMEVKGIFPATIDTGIKHGTVTVMLHRVGYEVTTYRVDGEYEDARHPKEVTFTRSLKEDLCRRDFTINAMAYSERSGVVDLFGGCEDLENKVIRCVGEPSERFSEDALRMMRAVRFSAALGFEIEEKTAESIKELAPTLVKVSAERIRTELEKTVVSPNPDRMRTVYELGISGVVFPEFDRMMEFEQNNRNHCYSVGEHTIHAMENSAEERILRLALLFHDVGKPLCKTTDEEGSDHFHGHPEVSEKLAHEIMRRLKYDNATISKVCRLCRWHDLRIEPRPKYLRRAINRLREDLFPIIFYLQRADVLAQSDFRRTEKIEWIEKNEQDYEEILRKRECLSLKDLAVSGRDLIDAGVKPGKDVGEILNRMLEEVLDDPEKNDKEYLMSMYVTHEE